MPPSPLLTVASSSTASSGDGDVNNDKPPAAESANSSNDLLQSVQNSNNMPELAATPPTQSVTPAYADDSAPRAAAADTQSQDAILDQHEDDVTQFLHTYSVASRVIDQFDVTQALLQNQVPRVHTPPPPPPPPETYEALLNGLPPGRKSPSLPIQETTNRMLFGKNDKALSNRRRMFATSSAFTDYEADLSSSDRVKAKQSVMRFLKERIKSDWKYTWPKPDGENTDTEYEFDEDNAVNWREREDWESGISEDDEENRMEELAATAGDMDLQASAGRGSETAITSGSPPMSPNPDMIAQSPGIDTIAAASSPFRFETPEKVGELVQKKIQDKKERRRKRRLEMQAWNEGLDCWTRRRDAWTCARKVPPSSMSQDTRPPPPKISFNDDTPSDDPASPCEGNSTTSKPQSTPTYTPITQIPIAQPLIPPENGIRSQIGPAVYGKIYEKVVTSSITPAVPINLKDITRSCVEGWKREGEWPPRPTAPEPSIAHGKRMGMSRIKSLGLLSKGRRDSGGSNHSQLGMILGTGPDSRRSSLASVFGLDKVKSMLGRRGSGSKDGDGGTGAAVVSPGLPPPGAAE